MPPFTKLPDRPPVNSGPRLAVPESPSSPFARPNTLAAGSQRATINWLRVGSAALRKTPTAPLEQKPVPMIDISSPASPNSVAGSRRPSNWDATIANVAMVSARMNCTFLIR